VSKSTDSHDRLTILDEFGTDPGSLHAGTYIPKNFPKNGPLVVVLHGCTQSAEIYNCGSGWSALADECGIALLFPEQRRTNNLMKSFHWYQFGDSRRGGGEPLSIRHMIKQVVGDHAIDPSRVFITGLSSGGAMANVMLATYPEVFAGGAIIGGLPYRSAGTLMQAIVRMKGYGSPVGFVRVRHADQAWGDMPSPLESFSRVNVFHLLGSSGSLSSWLTAW